MKIIKQGKSKEEIEKVLRHTLRFTCGTCGCVFEADKDEYHMSVASRYIDPTYFCKCPNCGTNAYETKMR